MPAFRPSLVVNLKLRFDEALTLVAPPPPATPDQLAVVTWGPSVPAPQPLITRTGQDNVSFVMGRVPSHASFELPGYRQAATFECELPYRDLPVDPRTVRAAALEAHLGTVSDADFSRGVLDGAPQGTRSSILQTRAEDGQVRKDTLVGVFLVDEWKVTYGDKAASVTLKGRDLRGALLDTPVGTSPAATEAFYESVHFEETVDQVVAQVLRQNPLFADVRVVCNPAEWPGGVVPSPGEAASVPRHRRGAKGDRKGSRANPGSAGGSGVNLWDLVVRTCYLVGAIPYFIGTDLLVRPSRSIFDQARAGEDPLLDPTPFTGGAPRAADAVTGAPVQPALRYRRLVYGRDVRELEFERKYAGYRRPKVVRVVTSTAAGASFADGVLSAQWPPASEGTQVTRVAPSGGASQQEVLNIPVAGVSDPVQLESIARSVFEEIGRGEMGGSFESPSLASFGGDNSDPDLLRLKPGDGVEFAVDVRALGPVSPLVSTVTDSYRAPFDQAVDEVLSRLGGDVNLARVVVATARGQVAQLQRFFRVSNVRYDWDWKSGCKVSADFQNYVVARNQFGSVSSDAGTPAQTHVDRPAGS